MNSRGEMETSADVGLKADSPIAGGGAGLTGSSSGSVGVYGEGHVGHVTGRADAYINILTNAGCIARGR